MSEQTTGHDQAAVAEREPWDQRLARIIVRPLVGTPVTPNQLTTLRLLTGLAGIAFLAMDSVAWWNWGAALYIFSTFLDHADGELARLQGKTSRFGHRYDLTCDATIQILLFAAIGVGQRGGILGDITVILGVIGALGVAGLYWIFGHRASLVAKERIQPRWGGFEIEDVIYLFGPVVWFGGLLPLLIAGAGAPLVAGIIIWAHRDSLRERFRKTRGA